MKRNSTGNQKGEVILGAMAVICVVMMLFGGLHVMHGGRDHRHGDDHAKIEQKHDHETEGKRQPHDGHANPDTAGLNSGDPGAGRPLELSAAATKL